MGKYQVHQRVSYHGMQGTILEDRDSKYVVLFDGPEELILTPYESELTLARDQSDDPEQP